MCLMLGAEPRAFPVLDKYDTTELSLSSFSIYLFILF